MIKYKYTIKNGVNEINAKSFNNLINTLKCNQMKITFLLLCFLKGLHNRDFLNKNEGEIIFIKFFYKLLLF